MTEAHAASPAPVFVYGALRSGTTVFRLMLNSHPGIANPGEVDFLFDHLHPDPAAPDGWRYDRAALVADRIFGNFDLDLPSTLDGLDLLGHMIEGLRPEGRSVLTLNIHRHADKIAAALPEARFIHLLRDPRDVARSAIGMGWVGHSYFGAKFWLKTELGWDQAEIAEDRVLTLSFETLMAEIDPELHRVCAFLGVPFDPQMLEYYHGTNFAPPDPKIAFSWKRKATPHEVALIEGRVGPLLEARGYVPNGAPHIPGPVERMTLMARNKMQRWRFNMRRYGAGLFLSTHLARMAGLRSLHQRLRQRQEDIRAITRK
ncbi:MAG: sulfotransferase [Pseudomonadota bacterium]